MIHTQTVTIAGRETLLLIVAPDWKTPVRQRASVEAEVHESVTGIQERRSAHEAPRLTLAYNALLRETDLQTLRIVLATLEDRPVAIPFWPDVLRTGATSDSTDWANRVLAGQINVGWNGNFQNVVVTTGGSNPDRAWRGALLVGRLNRPVFRGETDNLAGVELTFVEDSPWECRVEPAGTAPSTWPEDWSPDWRRRPEQSIRVLQEHDTLGRGRQTSTEGDDLRLWRQSATLSLQPSALAPFFAFYVARRGGVEAFALPSALQPGANAPGGPHAFDAANGRIRFAESDLRLNWITPDLADVRMVVEQQTELEPGAATQEPPAFAFLYRFEYEGEQLHLTDREAPISAMGETWQPARIEHDRIRQSLKPQNEECEITAHLADVPLVEPFARMELETPAKVEILEMTLPAGTPQTLFTGTIRHARVKGAKARLKAAAFGGALARKVPRFQWSVTCNHTLFSHGCTRRRPGPMNPINWRVSGAFDHQWGDYPRVVLAAPQYPAGGPRPDHYYAGGWLETGEGTTRQVREILDSFHIAAEGRLHLILSRPLRTDQMTANQTLHAWPGCDGEYRTCQEKFSNRENFGGFPFLPTYIEQAPQSLPKGGK
ncbi:MAG: phage BR0599 family protein [Opitutales bacterium]|nr:phage BR0599 family protein [Opitutales bacterium]